MAESFRFFQDYESIIYFVLGIGLIVYGWRFWRAWQEMSGSIFGLEQVNAQRRLNQTAIVIFMILVMGFVVFSLVTFAPLRASETSLGQNTPIVVNSNDGLPVGTNQTELTETPTEVVGPALPTPLSTVIVDPEGCVPGEIEITSPSNGEVIQGVVMVEGVVNVENFGYYKFEISKAQEEAWLPIQVGRSLVPEEGPLIEEWDTSIIPPDNYVIQLVVLDNDRGKYPPCRLLIRIESPP